MPALTISITDHQRSFLDTEVQSGGYSNVSEVVRAALRLLENQKHEREARLRDLRLAIDVGDTSGTPVPLEDIETFLSRASLRLASNHLPQHES